MKTKRKCNHLNGNGSKCIYEAIIGDYCIRHYKTALMSLKSRQKDLNTN